MFSSFFLGSFPLVSQSVNLLHGQEAETQQGDMLTQCKDGAIVLQGFLKFPNPNQKVYYH